MRAKFVHICARICATSVRASVRASVRSHGLIDTAWAGGGCMCETLSETLRVHSEQIEAGAATVIYMFNCLAN